MGEAPLLLAGGPNATVACPSPGTALALVGADGGAVYCPSDPVHFWDVPLMRPVGLRIAIEYLRLMLLNPSPACVCVPKGVATGQG